MRGLRRGTAGATESGPGGRIAADAAAFGATDSRSWCGAMSRTGSACTTCTGTCRNGWRTAGTGVTGARLRTARLGCAGTARGACRAAGPGPTVREASARRPATGVLPSSGFPISASASPGRLPRSPSSPLIRGHAESARSNASRTGWGRRSSMQAWRPYGQERRRQGRRGFRAEQTAMRPVSGGWDCGPVAPSMPTAGVPTAWRSRFSCGAAASRRRGTRCASRGRGFGGLP